MKKVVLWTLRILAAFVVLIFGFYAEENWRGKHAWEKYRRDREAKGDSFEWSSVVPPSVPEDQNFAAAPLFAELFPKPPEHLRLDAAKLPNCRKTGGNWQEGRIENLAAWQSCLTNSDLLAALSQYDPILHEIGEASRRPTSQFPIRYQDNGAALVPHLPHLKDLAALYRLRALVELSASQSGAALGDVQMCLRLADTIRDELTMISLIFRVQIVDMAIQPVWEGLATHRWSENELTALQAHLDKMDQFDSLACAIRGERVKASRVIESARGMRGRIFSYLCDDCEVGFLHLLEYAIPAGWFYQNQLSIDRFYTQEFLPVIDFDHRQISPKAIATADDYLRRLPGGPLTIGCRMLLPAMTSATLKVALSQTAIDQAAVACALERYRLVHGQLPDTLGALKPEFLARVPRDVIDGQPLRYRRIDAEQFILYSVGWNETDDDGQIGWTRSKPPRQDLERGDWVWFSQPQPSASERK